MRIRVMGLLLIAALALDLSGCVAPRANSSARFTNADPLVKGAPTVVDLGSDQCDTCKQMVPVLTRLSQEYRGRLNVQFIDVYQDPVRTRQFKVQAIPTQVFLDGQGKELYRHVGYLGYADMVATLERLGVVQ